MTETVRVNLGERSYDILIGNGLMAEAGRHIAPLLARPRVAVLSDETVAAAHLDTLRAGLEAAGITMTALAPPTELSTCAKRLGGTSLLAQVDSSVGGKTGINAPQGKNLIGAFHQPSLVLADTGALATLPRRDVLAGYGEVVKYGLLGDSAFFDWLEDNANSLIEGDVISRDYAVKQSCQMKADIVARDETEQGDRALLNLGHTFCHALESATGYSDRLLHGEGVAIGCALAFELSARLGLCAQEDPSRLRAHLRRLGTKVDLSDIPGDLPSAEALYELMGQDKKVVDGQIKFVLARGIGQAFVSADAPREQVLSVLWDALNSPAR